MATYAVGDIQGCLKSLEQLLEKTKFDSRVDCLLSVGDIVNRGPDSLGTLRFVKSLGSSFRMVLGNHDLHLLAVAAGVRPCNPQDTLDDILTAPDRDELLHWLKQQPLLLEYGAYLLVHAGIPPQWSAEEALSLAAEVEYQLRVNDAELLQNLYGNKPDWQAQLVGYERWRAIINAFTRMRFCSPDGLLDLATKNSPDTSTKTQISAFQPWYSHRARKTLDIPIIFGHWAALQGRECGDKLFPLDTGCVWGGRLRCLELENQRYHHVECC